MRMTTTTNTKPLATLSALLLMAGFAGVANAAPIAVTNAGFETPAGSDGVLDNVVDASTNPSTGWTKSGGGQIYNPGLNANAPEGSNSYLILDGIPGYDLGDGSILQVLDDVLKEGTYTLDVEVGENATASSVFGTAYQVEIGVMDGGAFRMLANDPTPVTPSNGFETSTAELDANGHADLGLPLAIRLSGDVAPGTNNQVLFDAVRLDFLATPADVDVYLQAQAFDKVLPGGGTVPMWGFASCTPGFASCELPADSDAPGPQIDAFEDSALRVHVRNTLSVPVSIIVPGQAGASDGSPQMMGDDGSPQAMGGRVRSFTQETGAGADATYTWNSLRAGTYLYQSGTLPSLQVPMGLYGALVVAEVESGVALTEAYGHSYNAEAVLLLSEIDPMQNIRVSNASATMMPGIGCVSLADYERSMTPGYPCAVDYNPMYFLINGEPTVDLPAGDPADTALIRFLNAGLRSHTPSIVGVEMGLIAEDGNAYPGQARNHSAVLLAAGKTLDAIIDMPDVDRTYSLFDRMPTFSNENLPNGGSLANLQVGTGTPPVADPINLATNDAYDVAEDTPLTVGGAGGVPGVLGNDDGLGNATAVSDVAHGTLECTTTGDPGICSNGTFTYTPNTNYSGPDSFTYSASAGGDSYGAQVMLDVSFVNDGPVAVGDTYENYLGSEISVPAPGVLGNDADADGDQLFAELKSGSATLDADGSFTASAGPSFTYAACDRPWDAGVCSGLESATVTVDLTVRTPSNITLKLQEEDGTQVVGVGYRWTLEEDTTFKPDPNAIDRFGSQATTFHKSYMPVVAQGCVGPSACSVGEVVTPFNEAALDPTKHYFVTVLPADAMDATAPPDDDTPGDRVGHTVGGAQIPPGAAGTEVTVNVNREPLPYAQISIFVFNDNGPTNGAVDLQELGLGGFQITLEDGGGRYGMSAGQMLQDANGNNLVNSLDCFGGAEQSLIVTCPNTQANQDAGLVGRVLIKNLWPGKYGIITTPGLNSGQWVQTSTIEGTKVIDAWVKAGEPPFFTEFGPVGVHAFVGFVNPEAVEASRDLLDGTATITGAVTNKHMSRPPNQGLEDSETYDALAHTQAWVGLNSVGGRGANIAAVQATYDDVTGVASFEIPGVPRGFDYQIVVWDAYLDQVIAYRTVTAADIDAGGNVGNIPVFQWFARLENHVFHDKNRDGIWQKDAEGEDAEGPLAEQAVSLRWRDGTMYQSFPTDLEGFVPFDQVFPFFAWLVAEVDYARYDATGLTVTVDHGGDVSLTGNVYNPQEQGPCTQDDIDNEWNGCTTLGAPYGDPDRRTETGQVLTQGFQGFLGQTSVFEWGKAPYEPGKNGGISGIVYYGVTRAEADPRLTAAEPWEPGIPRVPVRLYRVVNQEASSIPVVNAGFEIPSGGNGIRDINVDGSNGWIKTGGGQIFNPGNNSNAPEGSNSYIILDGPFNNFSLGSGSVEQQLTDVLTQGSYSLSVQVGENATSRSVFGTGYQVQFGVNSTNGFVLLAEDNSSLAPSAGFLTSTVTYSVGADNDYLDMPLVIRLAGQVEAGFDNQVLFDDVRLDFSTRGLALVQETLTDSWDDNLPTGCPGADPIDNQIVGFDVDQTTGITTKCYDGLRNFNQARPAVFDGGYAFNDIPSGEYVVEVVPPPGYELTKEEDVNVSFGDGYATPPITFGGAAEMILPDAAMVEAALLDIQVGIAQPPCVGELREVPQTMSLFPAAQEDAPFRGAMRPLCDRKKVILSDQGQAAADFTLHTDAPIAAHFSGMILDDIAQEFNKLSPQFGEKWAPPFVPVSVRDYTGNEIARVYSDQWGRMNGLMPSTFTANMPAPSGFSPAMHQTCMNDPGPIEGPNGTLIIDPQYNPAYSNFCYTFQYMPGATTYLDTPVVPVSAFASGYNPPDCSLIEGTPMIRTVDGDRDSGIGSMLSRRNVGGSRGTLTITSMGMVEVPNPAYEGPLNLAAGPKTIVRNYGFGDAQGTVTIGGRTLNVISWTDSEIVARARNNTRTGQLVVTRGDNGNVSEQAVTVTVYNSAQPPAHTFVSPGQSIQAAIDGAGRGDLILVEPGVYNESIIMWKPVRLQGAGAGSTMINAVKRPTEVLVAWRQKMDDIFAMRPREVNALPNQLEGAAGFTTSEGAAITVLGRNTNGNRGFSRHPSRIDGFGITGGDVGGGILVNGYAHDLEVSNNNVYGNSGTLHGGIRVGQPFLELEPPQEEPRPVNENEPWAYGLNTGVRIHHNAVTRNGGLGGAGGGISLSTGSDGYDVSSNFVCGNFTKGDGGGIAHLGLSDRGQIRDNKVFYNQSFNQAVTVSGGGVFVGGEPIIREFLELDNPDQLSIGSGNVDIRDNHIQGNQAAAGHGGGIRTQYVNGWDVGITGDRPKWFRVRILDNVIVNNQTGWAGGGISLHNTVRGILRRNTVAHNDSTATVGGLVVNDLSTKQPAGIATEPHSIALAAAILQYDGNRPDREFSTPWMGNPNDNTVWENRSFHYEVAAGTAQLSPVLAQSAVGECPAGAIFWDYDARILDWRATGSGAPGPTADVDFGTTAFCNGGRTLSSTELSPAPGPMFALPALDEGGNAWIDVRFGPLTPSWPEGSAPWSYEVTP